MSNFDEEFGEKLSKFYENEYLTRKQDIIQHAEQEYGQNWKSQLAMRLAGTSDKKSAEYKNQMRNFQGTRLGKDAGGKKWEQLGKSFGPMRTNIKANKITVVVKGTQARGGYKGGTRQRTFKADMSGTDLYDFVTRGEVSLSRWGDEIYGFDFIEDGGDDTSSGETEVTSVSVY